MRKLLTLLFLVLATSLSAAPRLFHIARNLNRNIIVYDLRLKGNALDKKEPMHVYWYNQEQTPPTTNELSFIQRKMAYGYSVVSATAEQAVIKMKATGKRTIKICKRGGQWIATTTINGRECQLQDIYAHCPSKTSCDYIELHGISLADGSMQKERIKN